LTGQAIEIHPDDLNLVETIKGDIAAH